jgi:ubiquinone/menaquinone biosynthesis C-methylase UbiE
MITRAMGGLFVEHPDLSQVQSILDVYCGPGGWALETAFHYPGVEVVGIDCNRDMIDYARAQANVQGLINAYFIVMEACQALDFPGDTFDIVNARFIAPFLSKRAWPEAVQEFVRVTKPGGIVRLVEIDELGISNSRAHEKMKGLYGQALAANGQSFHPLAGASQTCITPMLGRFLANAGCEEIQEQAYVLNYSAGQDAFRCNYENLKVLYKLGQPFLLAAGVATQEELDDLYESMLIEMLAEDFRALWYFLSVWGYKPDRLLSR